MGSFRFVEVRTSECHCIHAFRFGEVRIYEGPMYRGVRTWRGFRVYRIELVSFKKLQISKGPLY